MPILTPKSHRLTLLAAALTLLTVVAPVTAQSLQMRLETLINSADLGDAVCAVSVVDTRDGIPVASYKADRPMIPASNMKLVTSAAALGVLGPDFHFTTQLLRQDNNLIVISDGDPAFGDPKLLKRMGMDLEDMLSRWVVAAQKAGVQQVDTLIVDARSFDTQRVHPNWPQDQLIRWYCAQVAGINFNNNCISVHATYTAAGQTPNVRTLPVNAPVVLTNAARSGKRNEMILDRDTDTNRITISGQVAKSRGSGALITVHDPALFFGHVLRDRLASVGITVNTVRHARDNETLSDNTQLIAEVKTPITEVIARCNKDSQNLFAEALIKRVGREATGDPGTWSSGGAAERMFLSKLLGPQAAGFVIDDGSGLSRQNRVSAELLTDLLTEMYNHPTLGEPYVESLSIGSIDGSLRNRFKKKSFTSQIYGKTGYIRGVVALSGYIEDDSHHYAFSIILNNYPKPLYKGQRDIDTLVYAIDDYLAGRRMDLDTGQVTTNNTEAPAASAN